MSLRQVLTIYNAERQLSDDETALLNTLRKMTDAERGMFVDGLSDKPQKKSSKKSASKKPAIPLCAVCGYTETSIVHKDEKLSDYHPFQPPSSKSKRATDLGNAIRSRAQEKVMATTDDDGDDNPSDTRCQFLRADGKPCNLLPDHNIHHLQTANEYHEFQSAAAAAVGGD